MAAGQAGVATKVERARNQVQNVSSMKILVTNVRVDTPTGTEVVVRDLAVGLHRRGHQVAVYTPHPGRIAAEIQASGIAVVDSVDLVPFVPDVIHGHHHSPTVEALAKFPDSAAIWVCHDRLQFDDIPPTDVGIGVYVAVDLNCFERLAIEASIPIDRIELVHNAVDLRRYPTRRRQPRAIRRAAVFSNQAQPGGYLDAIVELCQRRDIALDVLGTAVGRPVENPEQVLGHYDVVFAKARCALEAMAAGCAVVLIDAAGMGPLVTMVNVSVLRDWNFGSRCLQSAVSVPQLEHQLDKLDRRDVGSVTDWIRSVADLEHALDRYELLYRRAIDAPRSAVPTTLVAAMRSTLSYSASLERRLRVLEQPVHAVPLPSVITSSISFSVSDVPTAAIAGNAFGVDVRIVNDSAETLSTTLPFDVNVSYHWVCPADPSLNVFDGARTPLARPIHPGSIGTVRARVAAPAEPGDYLLHMTLVQESVFWFDSVDPPIVTTSAVRVGTEAIARRAAPMTLASLAAGADKATHDWGTVVRNGTFADLGFADDAGTNLLTFAQAESFLGHALANPNVSCVITTEPLAPLVPDHYGLIVCQQPKAAFFHIHNWLVADQGFYGQATPTFIAASARIHATASIDPCGVVIGEHCQVGPNAVIHGPVVLGDRSRVDAGAVIGAEAFQTSSRLGDYVELTHAGSVAIGADCHIYSNATIVRGVFRSATIIGDRSQIGNGAFISHQCQLGTNVFVGHNATVNGRVVIGNDAWIGPGSVVSNSLHIGSGASVALGSTVMQNLADGQRVSGLPAMHQHTMFRHAAAIRRVR